MSRAILIFANCQGEELLHVGSRLPSLAGCLAFKWIPLHLVTQEDWATRYGADFMSDVAVLWEQVETGPPSAARQALQARLPEALPVVRFPPFSALCLWPFAGSDPRLATDPERYPWPDSVAATLAPLDLPDDRLFSEYMRITSERMPDLERRLRLDLTRWRAADAIADIQVADWVERQFREIRLFHTAGHVTAAPTAFMLKQLLARTELVPQVDLARLYGEVDQLLRHHQGQDFESVPLHPLVAERLRLRFFEPDARYRWHAHEWTLREYILHYTRWTPYMG
jgi:hypothetical protein